MTTRNIQEVIDLWHALLSSDHPTTILTAALDKERAEVQSLIADADASTHWQTRALRAEAEVAKRDAHIKAIARDSEAALAEHFALRAEVERLRLDRDEAIRERDAARESVTQAVTDAFTAPEYAALRAENERLTSALREISRRAPDRLSMCDVDDGGLGEVGRIARRELARKGGK